MNIFRIVLLTSLLASLVYSAAIAPPQAAHAATFTVNSALDRTDANPGDGVCAASPGVCTLRAAIQEANAFPGADTINLPAGVYELQIPTLNDDLDTTGDLDIHTPLTIVGAGAGVTIVDGGWPLPGADPTARGLDRLFEIHPNAGNVTFRDLTLREGFTTDDGGAIQNWSSGLLRLENVHVRDSYAGGAGGGVNNADPAFYEWATAPLVPPKSGRVEIVNSTFSGNAAGSSGAAVNNASNGTVSILAGSQIINNPGLMIPDPAQVIDPLDPEPIEYVPAPGVYEPGAGAVANEGATDSIGALIIADATIAGNFAASDGAGILNGGDGAVTIERTTILSNTTEADGGGLYAAGGAVTVSGSTIRGNVAANGGGLYSNGSVDSLGLRPRFTLTGSTVSGNEAHASGGGMYNGGDGQLTITDVTFSGNKAHDDGGGLEISGRAGATLTRVTFTDNQANGEGGGAWTGSTRLITIQDSVFSGNDAGVPTPGDLANPAGANVAGGGGLYTENGPVTITGSTFENNTATEEGGGLRLDNLGDVTLTDSVIRNNHADVGGGVENSGTRVTFERLLVTNNYAEGDGGGIYSSASGLFTIVDTTVSLNSGQSGGGMANAPDNHLIIRRSLFLRNTARTPAMLEGEPAEDAGLGGGLYSLADGESLIENTTFSGNTAAVGGGGLFHDADGPLELVHLTIWRNSAPMGGAIGVVESDFAPPVPPKANVSVIARNSLIGGSLQGGSCDWYITSEGGNIDTGGTQSVENAGELGLPTQTWCFLSATPGSDTTLPARDRRSAAFTVDALADNGGRTLTHAIRWGSLAQDTGVSPCPETDQRGVARPQNGLCDAGAYEFVGDPLPPDATPPETEFPAMIAEQDGLETMALRFRGADDVTPADELQFECRLFESELAEAPEPIAPWDPIPPELWWVGCSNPWQVPIVEPGLGYYTFEVRAIDRAGNVDPTPAVHILAGDTNPPETVIAEMPPLTTNSRSATFTFTGYDNFTPPQFMEFECRLDSRDPDLWLECANPALYSNLTSGEHTLEVRAYDGAENVDPTPARYTWTVGQGPNCDLANITLTAVADGWVDEVNPTENYLFMTELGVRSAAVGDPTAVPPVPVVGQNARALFRFALPTDAGGCELESATLRLYNESPTEGRTLQAVPIAGAWLESTLTWFNQPGTLGGAVTSAARHGYQEWDVTGHVYAMLDAGVSYGWMIRDAAENDPDGGDQSFLSREMPQDPPDNTLPQLVLRYAADASPPPPPPAEPDPGAPITAYCGQVITQSVVLGNDLTGCLGEGLVVGAPNIVIDLGGRTISSGLVLDPGEEDGLLAGIRNGGRTNVVIRNGTITGFGYGVLLGPGTTRNIVEDLTLTGNVLAGVQLVDADDGRTGNIIRGNYFDHNGETGVTLISDSENSVIENNTFIGNGMSIYLFGASGHRIEGNDISGVVLNPLLDSDAGIVLEEGSSRNVLLNNDISDTGDAGVIISTGSHDNRVEGGALVRNGDAGVIVDDSDRTQVIGVLAHGQSDSGVALGNAHDTVVRDSDLRFNPSGVSASNTNNLVVENNNASESLQSGFEFGNGLNMRIRNNTANNTGGAGIALEGGAFDALGNAVGGALIEGNTANENLGDGITAAAGGHTLRDNAAYNNFGFGIYAEGNLDGGGNVASGNAEPEQCVGVVCAAGSAPPATPADTTAPETTITGGPANPTGSASATFTFSATDNVTPLTAMAFECRLDPPPDPAPEVEPPGDPEPPDPGQPPAEPVDPTDPDSWSECSSPVHYTGLEQGLHRFEVRAIDQAGNTDFSAAGYTWDIDITIVDEEAGPDSTPPDTRLTSAPGDPTTSTSATFTFAGTDNLIPGLSLTFECQIDGQGFLPCANPATYSGLDPGPHTFQVRALDRALNADPTPAARAWTIVAPPPDTTPPDTAIDSGPDPITVLTTATFTFSSPDPTATFECALDGGPFAICTAPRLVSGLAPGAHTYQVRAVDPAGNADPTPAVFAWTISAAPVPTTVFCGMVVTHSIRVNNDLHDCLWDGLVVGAHGITIDLNGRTLDGVGQAAGIRNDGYDFVSIKNGAVVEFDYGVMLNPGTEDNIVEAMTLQSNQEAGLGLGFVPHPLDPTLPFPQPPPPTFQAGLRDNILRDNTLLANDTGIWLTNGTRGTLIHANDLAANTKGGILLERSSANTIAANQINASSEPGVALVGSSDNAIVGNSVEDSGGGVYLTLTDSAAGYTPSNANVIEANVITESGGPAIELAGSSNGALTGNQILDNVASFANGEGLLMYYADDTLVRGNTLSGNKAGIQLANSSHNRLESNNTSDSEGAGIWTGDNSQSNEIVGNASSNNTGVGIYVGDEVAGDSGTLIEGNHTHNNNSYGIHVAKPSHIVKNNLANENGSWGIYAGDPSNGRVNVDGGGNRAQDNLGPIDPFTLQPLQCYNVLCDGGDAPPDPIPPDTLILQTPPHPSLSDSATFHFSGSDNVGTVTFECRVDGLGFTPCASPATYTGLGDGAHTFEARAVDLSGNVDPSPASYAWTVLLPAGAPETTITGGPDPTTARTDATFTFAASESGSTFACALDGSGFALCASPQTYTGLAAGAHTFQVRATDGAGDTDASPASYAWTIGAAPVPTTVGCGEIVVQSIRLLNDLIDCGGYGLIIGAPGLTLDLNGHVIDGVGLDAGILNNGYDSVTILNGTITQFDYGILLNPGTARNIIDALRLESNQEAGLLLSDADQNGQGNTIRNSAFAANGYGIWLASNTSQAVIRGNALGGNTAGGVHLEFASNNLIEFNEITRSGGHGIAMVGGGGNTVSDNSLSGNSGYGIAAGEELLPSNNNLIQRNTVSEGQGGILVAGSTGNQVLFNSVSGSTGPGIVLDLAGDSLVRGNDVRSNASGISLSESSNNRIESNNASGTLGAGIEIGALSYTNVVIQNAANQNGGEGITVEDFAQAGQGNVIEANTADGNGGDGLGVHGVGHTLTGNRAQMNGGWGIYVAVSATDGGGNFAAGNAEPAQCLNIVCTLGVVPGSPETWIVSGPVDVDPGTPGVQSNSRNASFTYNGSDDATPLINLVFECRLGSTNDLAWEDCEYPAEFLNLGAGPHVLEVRAVDLNLLADPTPARFEWTYVPLPSGVAPEVSLDLVPDNPTQMFEALFTFRANEPDVTFECRVDFFGYEPCGFEGATFMAQGAYEAAFEETQVGPHTFYVRAIDFEGNVGAPATYTWSILGIVTTFLDGPGFTPGETPLDPPTGGPVLTTTATLDFIANVADATYECSLDLGPFLPCAPPVTYTGLIPGGHMLRVIATDLATGAEELEAAVFEWEIVEFQDVTPPNTTIELAPPNNSSATTFEFTGVDDLTPPSLLTFECRVDSASDLDWFACVSPFNLLDLFTYADFQMAPGPHTFEVRAIDLAEPLDPNSLLEGNPDPTPASYTWTMVADTTPPGTGLLSGPPATVGQGAEILIEFFGADNATPVLELTFECAVDAGPFEPCASPESVSGLAPGPHTVRVRAVDLAGNADPTPAESAFTVMPAPVTTITSGPAGQIIGGVLPAFPSITESAIFVFAADQPGSTFECALDGSAFVPCASPYGVWVTLSGPHAFTVRATNPEGVVEEPPAAYAWLVELANDITPPNTTITSAPGNPSASEVATFSFAGSDNRTPAADLTFECALDGAGFNSCVAPQQFSDLAHGAHTLLIRARDAAGNFDPTPASYTWVVELPPVTTILTGPAEVTEEASATFTFAANVPGSTFQCWLDGVITACASPVTYTGLAAGDHLFAVLATAPAGTLELAWAEWEWTIADTTPPITTITSGPEVQTETTSATFTFTANEPNVTFTCSLDGGTPLPCASPVEYPFLHPGPHTFEVVAANPPMLDPLGQPVHPIYDLIPTVYEWTIMDLAPPDTTITFGPAATTGSASAYFGFSSDDPTAIIQCALDGAAYSACETPAEFTDLSFGAHTLLARAVDLAGNADPTPASYAWTIVQLAPNTPVGTNVTVELPLPGGGTATLTFFEVFAAGVTTLDVLGGAPPLPAGYFLAGGQFYDISTTADYSEPATLCLPYNPASFPEGGVRLLHWDGSAWIDVTLTNDPVAGLVCGQPEGFSPFAVASGSGLAPLASITSGPPAVSNSGTATFTFVADPPGALTLCSLDGLPFTACASPVTYTFLESGSHNFQVQAVGLDGQTQPAPALYAWEVSLPPDTTPPDTTITRGAPALTVNTINWFEFAGADDQTAPLELEFECALDGGPFEACETPEEITVLTAGAHTLAVRAVDLAGNADPTPATWNWTVVDMSAPETSIDLGPNSETTSTSAIFEFSGEEPDGTPVSEFECSLDNADFTPCASPYEITGLAGGPHVFLVRAVDPAGVVDPTPDFYEWLIIGPADTTPPDTFIVAGPPPDNSGPDVVFGFASNEPVEGFECALDGGPFEGCEAVHELLGLAQGAHTLLVRAIDLAQPTPNVDPTPASYTWTTLGEPDTLILSGPPDPSGSFSATFTFTSTQAGATFQCSVDGTPYVSCTSPFVAGPLVEEGTHEFEVRAVNQYTFLDGSQVVDLTPATYAWELQDVEPPDTAIVSVAYLPPTDLIEPNSFRFEFAGTDNRTASFGLTFECSLDGGPFEGCDPIYYLPLEGLGGGAHELLVRAVDDLDNADPSPASYAWTTEGEPETTILSGPPAETDATAATFTFSSDQAGATFECALDGATTFTPCPSPVTFTDVPYGAHELLVRAVSPLGTQVDLTPAEYAWASGDLTPPVVTILAGPAATTLDTTATFTFSADDPEAQFQCSLDGLPLAFCASPATYTGLLGGAHTFEVVATKPNLLVEGVPAVWEWTVQDLTPPETAIVSGPPALTALGAPAAFLFSSNKPDAGFECSLNGGPFTACAAPPENTTSFNEPAGPHTLLVRAVDPSLNADATPATYAWTVVAPPATTITGPASPSLSAEATFTFFDQAGSTYACSLDGAPFAPCASPHTLTGLPDGAHTFYAQATNALGAVETPPASYGWTIADMTAPETTLDLTPPATTTSTSATFAFSSNEPGATFECALDGAAFAPCAPPHTIAGLSIAPHSFAVRAVDAAGNADPTPASYAWTVEAPAPPNTLVGVTVTVQLPLPGGATTATVTFAAVTADGLTTLEALTTAPPLPDGYLQAGAVYYDLSTTAAYNGPVTVCLTYAPGSIAEPARLLHYTGGAWADVTTTHDPLAGLICGGPGSLSPFAIATATAAVVPETTITSGPPAFTASPSADFAFSSNDPAATFECALDDPLDWGSCPATTTFTGLTVGAHNLLVRARNAAGLADATPAGYAWTVTPTPDTFIDSAPAAATESTDATFTFSSDQPGVTFECAFIAPEGEALFLPCASPQTYAGLAFGEYTFLVRATDADGNADPTPAEHEWAIGDIPAPVTITSGPDASTESTSATFVFSAAEASPAYECALDGAAFAPCASPRTYTGLAVGAHTFQVRVLSPNAVVEAPITTYAWAVADLTPPDTLIDAGPPAVSGNPEASLSFQATEPGATFECRLNGAPFTLCASPIQYTNLAAAAYTFEVRAVDPAGNQDPTPASHTWTVVAPPVTTLLSGPDSQINVRTATFTFSADQADATFECSLDGGPFTACASPHTVNDLPDGDHRLEVRARNAAGLVDQEPALHEWAVEAGPPETTVLSGPPAATTSPSATFTFAANEAGVTFTCSLDGAAFAECLTPHGVGGLAVGPHELQVRAMDGAGNTDPTPASYTWNVLDGAPPDTTINSGPEVTTTSASATLAFSANEAGATFECALDGAAFAPCASPAEYAGLAIGGHSFQVRATDAAGNTDPTPAGHTWTVVAPDTTAPDTVITDQPADPSPAGVSFRFAGSDETTPALLLSFECRLDSANPAAWDGCASPTGYADLGPGLHTFEVRAVDQAGNADLTPAAYTWTVAPADTTPPETTIDSGPPDSSSTSATFTFSASEPGVTFTCALDGVSAPCASPATYTNLAVGDHQFLVRASDAAGNQDPTAAVHEWTVEPPPDTTINGIASGSVIISFGGASAMAQQPALTFECRLDGQAFAPCVSPVTYSGLADGPHTFEVRAIDAAGNADPSPASFTWTGDPSECSLTGTLAATQDAWIDQNSSSNNFGSDAILKVRSQGPGDNFRALLRFPLPSVPAHCVVASATLRLYAASATAGRALEVIRVAGDWTEYGVTWDNQPGAAGSAVTALSGSGYLEWNVTGQMRSAYDAGASQGFLVRDAVEGEGGPEQQFHGRQKGENAPQLVISYALGATDTPEPTATQTPEPTGTPEPTSTPEPPTEEPTATLVPEPPTHTPEPTATQTPEPTATAAPTSTPEPTATQTPEPTATAAPTNTPEPTATQTPEPTATAAPTNTPEPTATQTQPPTPTATPTITPTATPSCTTTTVTVGANADSWVDQNSASNNFGTDSIIKVQAKSGNNFRTLVRFSLPAVPAGCVVQSATLRLYAASWTNGRTLQALRITASWAENTVKWSNLPATTGPAATTSSGSGYRQWNVASQVQAMYAGANNGFLIRDANEGGGGFEQQFHSREKGQNMPQLVITFGPASP